MREHRLKVIFVDDEPRVLRGLRRLLAQMSERWEAYFAESGLEALEIMASGDFDAIVTDMRMPGMDGAELLFEVQEYHPRAVRIVLSGQSDQETRLRAAGPTHQFLTKPCSREDLTNTVERACRLRDLLTSGSLSRLVTRIDSLPSMTASHEGLRSELMAPEPSLDRVSRLISDDMSMTAKLLQLVNTAFFGAPRRVTSPAEAVSLVGLNVIRDLIIAEGVFSQYDEPPVEGFSYEALRAHSSTTARYATAIASAEGQSAAWRSDAQLAGQLHDIGRLILAVNFPDEYATLSSEAGSAEVGLWQAEAEMFGASHAAVGAYLLGLWGLPDTIVEAVAFHHEPAASPIGAFSVVTAVHVADAIAAEHEAAGQGEGAGAVDMEYLKRLDLVGRLPHWAVACANASRAAARRVA